MKASNTQVMVQAYRMLVNRMMQQGMNYPLHLGVTEAGDGEDGRIKSAVGIGSLLEDGLGDTIRVSLTEEPEFEIPVAKALANRYEKRKPNTLDSLKNNVNIPYNPFEYNKRQTCEVMNFGNQNVPRVIADFSEKEKITAASLFAVGYNYSVPNDKWNISDLACDFIYVGNNDMPFEIPGTLGIIYNFRKWKSIKNKHRSYPLFCGDEYFSSKEKSIEINFVVVNASRLNTNFIKKIIKEPVVLVIDSEKDYSIQEQRKMLIELDFYKNNLPLIIKRTYKNISENELLLFAATDSGGLLIDGIGDGIWISAVGTSSLKNINSLAFGILQATRTRISKTEYISCPSCGRTLFDLQQTTAKIRAVTNHLKGVKIGIMGCIVNGPGEMADADYGYVGTGLGKITLYKQKNVIKKNVPETNAVDELINLIKENGDWIEPS
jgi:(E)-4-hydroxy-3-methylbut-2-enyl-diphosphate synthase